MYLLKLLPAYSRSVSPTKAGMKWAWPSILKLSSATPLRDDISKRLVAITRRLEKVRRCHVRAIWSRQYACSEKKHCSRSLASLVTSIAPLRRSKTSRAFTMAISSLIGSLAKILGAITGSGLSSIILRRSAAGGHFGSGGKVGGAGASVPFLLDLQSTFQS